MKRLMQDLGDLRGLDMAADPRRVPVRGDESRLERIGVGSAVALVRGLLGRPDLAAENGRCRAVEPADRPAGTPLPH